MPSTVNGIGTSYWGKAERVFRRGECEHCVELGDLASYDTTKYFVVVFVPLIPLGKLRIFDECPSCHRHGVMKLREWENLKKSEVEEAVALFRAQPSSSEAGHRLLQACAAYGKETQFLEHSKEVLQHHGGDASTLSLMSEVLEEYGHLEQAEGALKKSLQGEESPERRRRLRWLMIRNGRPQDARPGLAPVYAEGDATFLPDLYLLVEGFQAQGQHREALAELDAIQKAFPDEAKTKIFRHLRKQSESRRQTGEAVISPTLQPPQPPLPENDLSGKLARWGSPVLLLLLVGFLGWWLFNNGTRHPVYIVNGLDTRYSLEVAGRTVQLPPSGHVVERLPLRRSFSVQPAEGAPPFEPFEVKIDLSFREGFSSKRIPVLNPDRSLLLLRETVAYLPEEASANEALEEDLLPWKVFAGKSTYIFAKIDYPFEDFPDQIEMSSESSRVRRTRLGRMEVPPIVAWSLLQSPQADSGSARGWITAQVRLGLADETNHPYMLANEVESEEFRSLVGEHLAARPLKVGWHRAYQSLLTEEGQEGAVEQEYRGYLEEEGESPDLLYLLARVTPDKAASKRLLDKALAAPGSSPWPHYGAALRELASARFAPALELAQEALAVNPEDLSFQRVESQAMLANGRFEALAERSQEERADALEIEAASNELLLLTVAGKAEEAEELQKSLLQALGKQGVGGALRQVWQNRFQAARHLGAGDLEAYGAAIANLEEVPFPLHRALLAADGPGVMKSLKALREMGEPTPEILLLSHLACLENSPEVAAGLLKEAVDQLRESGGDQRRLAEALAAEGPPSDPEDILGQGFLPDLKVPVLAILARRGGPSASVLRDRAQALNYEPGFEGRLLQRLME